MHKSEESYRKTRKMRGSNRILLLGCLLVFNLLFAGTQVSTASASFGSSSCFRDLYLPPGPPSVALQIDENAILWNPSAIGLSSRYYIGYAWKGIYFEGKKEVTNHFFLTRSRGFGFGFMHDSHSVGVKTTTLLAISPPVSSRFSLGFTGKWRGGFNFDCGVSVVPTDEIRIAIVGRNLREDSPSPRYIEGGIAAGAISNKLTLFFDTIFEESESRKKTIYGCGILANWGHGFITSFSFFQDQADLTTIRAAIRLHQGPNIIEGEYWKASDRWSSLSARISYESQ